MPQPLKDAIALCKTIRRNGYDAYVISAALQERLLENEEHGEVDIATDMQPSELRKLFPLLDSSDENTDLGSLQEGDMLMRFYPMDTLASSHPEVAASRLTPRLMKKLEDRGELPTALACPYIPEVPDAYAGFCDFSDGVVNLIGVPDATLRRNYLLGVRALRFAANYDLPMEPNTWVAILRSASRILDYVPVSDIVDEWKKVEAENMARFFELLYETQILHGLIPELAALSKIKQRKSEDEPELETAWQHTLDKMRLYPETLPYDWLGTTACLFHDVGKLYTAEYTDGEWTFHQHPWVGAKITRKILKRLRFPTEDLEVICHLVRHHKRFDSMLTDRGIRRFKALDEYPRIIEMARADVKARGGNYTAFNHNMKYLERADVPEEMLEPLLNGKEIMDFTGLNPGPAVGIIRQALLQAQVAGDVTSIPEAVEFIRTYYEKEIRN